MLVHYRFDPIARLIQWLTKSEWNHVCWVLDNEYLLECSGSGVLVSKRSKYANKWLYKTKTIRLRGIDLFTIIIVLLKALKAIHREKWGYIKLFLTCFAILSKKRGFRLICSNFIALNLASVNYYFSEEKVPCLITPGDIANSKKVEVIENV